VSTFQLAQINISRMHAPLNHPIMKGFVDQLETINRIADHSPGFVWRLQGQYGSAVDIRAFDDEFIIVNMSVWESVEHLQQYVYRTAHAMMLRNRKEWFDTPTGPSHTMWWISAGELPTVEEGKRRLELLTQLGPTQEAFTFKHTFPPPTPVAV
jgi:hypothetical protein